MEDVRIYADFHGLSPEKFELVKDAIPFDQVEYKDNVLRVDHEGVYIDVEPFLETMAREHGQGALEFIDHVEWEVTRYVIKDGVITSKTMKVDNVLDAHMRDHGL